MDWDWEDGPPSDAPPPRRAADEPAPAADPRPPQPERAEPLDESVTQVFSAEAVWEQGREQAPDESASHPPSPEYVLPDRTETGRPAPSPEFERPQTRTTEAAQRATEAAERAVVTGARGPDDGYERRPRSTQDRAARREQRRRQLRRRRLVALAILIAIVVLIVVLVVRGCGGSTAAAATAALGMVFVDRHLLVVPERP
jgi:cobalamin biosynthesis Mg chelatase CobN